MMSGLVQIAGGAETTMTLLQDTISAGTTASIIIVAMSLGLVVPKMIIDTIGNRSRRAEMGGAAEHVNAR
jgi:hypothetical protein